MSDKEYYRQLWYNCRFRAFKFLLILCVAVVSMSMCSCKSTAPIQSQTENKEIKDSIRYIDIVHDSLNVVTVKNVVDSVSIRDSLVIVLDSAGNILQTKEWHVKESYRNERDSTAYYRSLAYQAIAELVKERNESKEVYVEKQLTKWQQFKIDYGGYSFFLLALLLIYMIYSIIRFFRMRVTIRG